MANQTLDTPEKSANTKSTFTYNVKYADKFSRGQLLLRTFFGIFYIIIPHAFVLMFLSLWSNILTAISWWIILFTAKYPESFFKYQIKLMRWGLRVNARLLNLADGYPAFGLNKSDDMIEVDAIYPEKLSRGKLLLKSFLGIFMLLPHAFVLMFRYIATMVLTQIAWWIILITAKYPKSWHEFNVGTLRWAARIQLYFGFMSDKYPPFSGLAEKDAVDSGKISEKKATENKPAAAKPESKIATAATPPPTPVKATPAPAVPKPEPEKPAVSTASKPIAVPASPKAENKPVQATTLAKDKEKSKKRPLLWMILTGIFLLASGLLGWQYFDLSGKIKHYMEAEKTWNEEKAVWENEKNGLLEQISNLNQENELLIAKMNDPMKNEKLRSIMEENAKLGERVKQLQASGGGDGGWKYKKEIESLKKQLEDLNAQLSALNGQNAQLSQEKSKLETDLGSEKNKTSQLKKDNDEMKKKMDEAKRLVIDDLVTGGVKLKRGGKKIVSLNKAKSSDKIQVCFSIGRNTLSDPGKRDFYIIITAPGNKVLGKESNTFDIDNSQKQYSIKQTEDYKNQEKLVCAYFEKAKEEKFATGKYSVEIYTEGNKVGESSFELK